MAKRSHSRNFFWMLISCLYLGIMVWLLFCRNRGIPQGYTYQQALQRNLNLNPFYTIENYLSVVLHHPESPEFTKCLTELLGNVLLFIPAGYLLPKLFVKLRKFFPFLCFAILSVFLIEFIQLITLLGYFDVDDMILNVPGMMIGYLLFLLIR